MSLARALELRKFRMLIFSSACILILLSVLWLNPMLIGADENPRRSAQENQQRTLVEEIRALRRDIAGLRNEVRHLREIVSRSQRPSPPHRPEARPDSPRPKQREAERFDPRRIGDPFAPVDGHRSPRREGDRQARERSEPRERDGERFDPRTIGDPFAPADGHREIRQRDGQGKRDGDRRPDAREPDGDRERDKRDPERDSERDSGRNSERGRERE